MEEKNITLYSWAYGDGVSVTKRDEDLKEVFISMDKALRYLHEDNCVVESFNPYDIELLCSNSNYIYYDRFSPIQNPFNKDSLIRDNLFKSACLQIGLFTNSLERLDIEFLKSNFDSFAGNIPSDLVPYYKGVITRGAGVYLNDFLVEKSKRDLISLQDQLGSEAEEVDVSSVRPDLTNKIINDKIYSDALSKKKIGRYNDYGIVNIMLLITIILVIILIVSIITLVLI